MKNPLFCYKGMSKNIQLELVYSDFIDMRNIRERVYVFYKPNKSVISFEKNGFMLDMLSTYEISRKMLDSFNICRYTFTDKHIQARKLSKRFVESLPTIDFSEIKTILEKKHWFPPQP